MESSLATRRSGLRLHSCIQVLHSEAFRIHMIETMNKGSWPTSEIVWLGLPLVRLMKSCLDMSIESERPLTDKA